MYLYIKCGPAVAIYMEFSKSLGFAPLFDIESCNGETIMNFPYGQIIITPYKKRTNDSKNKASANENGYKNTQKNNNLHAAPKRVTKNRS